MSRSTHPPLTEYRTRIPVSRGGAIVRTPIPSSKRRADLSAAHVAHVSAVRSALAVADGSIPAPAQHPLTARPNASISGALADVRRAEITYRRWLDADVIPAGSAGLFFRVADERSRALWFARQWADLRTNGGKRRADTTPRRRRERARAAVAADFTPADRELLDLRAAADSAARAIDGKTASATSWRDVRPSRTLAE